MRAEKKVEGTFGPGTLKDFEVNLENFQGPFDLLLRLIANRRMDLTEVALAEVSDEFLQYLARFPSLASATDFLVVAATLLQMKSAALLPSHGEEDFSDEDLEAWDLLFARLLQYQAFKEVATDFKTRWKQHAGAVPRVVPLESPFDTLLSPLQWEVTAEELAYLAAAHLTPVVRPDQAEHVAVHEVSFSAELNLVREQIERNQEVTFAQLTVGASRPQIVARFLALLQLYRRRQIYFEQDQPMGALLIIASDRQET